MYWRSSCECSRLATVAAPVHQGILVDFKESFAANVDVWRQSHISAVNHPTLVILILPSCSDDHFGENRDKPGLQKCKFFT